ncbi:MAG: J domain-containing protein [Spirochaetales bacterium]
MDNYYNILGVKATATEKELRDAYLKLIKKYHPDQFKGDKVFAEDISATINLAYTVLSEPDKRAEYDRKLEVFSKQGKVDVEDHIKAARVYEKQNLKKAKINKDLNQEPLNIEKKTHTKPVDMERKQLLKELSALRGLIIFLLLIIGLLFFAYINS